jgi:hypothetical protein
VQGQLATIQFRIFYLLVFHIKNVKPELKNQISIVSSWYDVRILILSEEHGLHKYKHRVLRRICGTKKPPDQEAAESYVLN